MGESDGMDFCPSGCPITGHETLGCLSHPSELPFAHLLEREVPLCRVEKLRLANGHAPSGPSEQGRSRLFLTFGRMFE